MSRKLTHLLILIIGAVMGSFIASLTRGIPFLSWLCPSAARSASPPARPWWWTSAFSS